MAFRIVAIALAAFCVTACAIWGNPPPVSPTAPAPTAVNPQLALDPGVYRLASGDSVRIDVLGEPDLSLTALVDSSGNISYPFLGHVPAGGSTPRELESRLRAGLAAGYLRNPDVRVSIAAYRPVYVAGQVRQAGAYPYVLGLTVEKVLTMAGGVTQFASSRGIYIQRSQLQRPTAEVRERAELGTPVFPGDTVIIEERLF